MQRFAFYDLDRTITRRPTWSRFLLYVVRRRAPWRALLIPLIGVAALARLVRLIDRDRLKEIMHHVLLGGRLAPAALERLAEGFAEREARHNIFAGARERIAADRAAGFRPVLATAAHEFYARPIAARLGIDDVVATRATIDPAGNILSRIEGENCYGAAKHRRVAGWIAERVETRQQAYARFYSDHLTDVPSLDWADEAIVINPGAALRLIAAARGWETLTWR